MGPDPKILDDIARVAGSAVNIVSGLQQQIRDEIKARIEDAADRLDLVPREDLVRAETQIAKLRQQIQDIEKRLAAVERGGSKKAAATPAPVKAAKKSAAPKTRASAVNGKKKRA